MLEPECSDHVFFIDFLVFGLIGDVHASAQIDHDDHTFYRYFFFITSSKSLPILNKGLFDSFLIFFPTVHTFLASQIYATEFAIDGIRVAVDAMCIFFVEIFDGEFECV